MGFRGSAKACGGVCESGGRFIDLNKGGDWQLLVMAVGQIKKAYFEWFTHICMRTLRNTCVHMHTLPEPTGPEKSPQFVPIPPEQENQSWVNCL